MQPGKCSNIAFSLCSSSPSVWSVVLGQGVGGTGELGVVEVGVKVILSGLRDLLHRLYSGTPRDPRPVLAWNSQDEAHETAAN